MQQFEGRVAVVTGAGGKVGLALSRRFASAGMCESPRSTYHDTARSPGSFDHFARVF